VHELEESTADDIEALADGVFDEILETSEQVEANRQATEDLAEHTDEAELNDAIEAEEEARFTADSNLDESLDDLAAAVASFGEQVSQDAEIEDIEDRLEGLVTDVIDNQQDVIGSLQDQVDLLIDAIAPGAMCAADYDDLDDDALVAAFKQIQGQGKKACRVTRSGCRRVWNKVDCNYYNIQYSEAQPNSYGRWGFHKWTTYNSRPLSNNALVASDQHHLMADDKCFGFPCPIYEAKVELNDLELSDYVDVDEIDMADIVDTEFHE